MTRVASPKPWAALLLVGLVPLGVGLFLARCCATWRWEHHPVHALVEGAGALIALIVAVLIQLIRRGGAGTPALLWATCALLGMGILDGLHAATHAGRAFVWLHSLATLVGGLLFAGVCLPATVTSRPGLHRLPTITVVAAVYVGVLSIAFPDQLPAMTDAAGFTWTAKVMNFVGGASFLAAAWSFMRQHGGGRWDESLLFAHHCLLFGIAGLVFVGSTLWDAAWWWWHFLRLTAYLVVLFYFFQVYRRALLTAHETALALERQVSQRTQEVAEGLAARRRAEDAVAQRNEELQAQRRAALSLAQDAEEARRRAERNQETLVKVNAELQHEIARRQRVEEELRASKERLDLALCSSGVGTWDWMIDQNAIVWDDYIHPLFGMRPGTFPGKYEAFLATLHPNDRDRVTQEVARAIHEDAEYDTEFRVVWPDASVHVLGARGKVYKDREGHPVRMTGVCWDITARRQAEEDLRRLAAELARSNAELEQFAYIASHDLQEPLRKIQAFGDLLAQVASPALDDKARLYLERMQDAACRMQGLINDLLTFSRVTSQARTMVEIDLGQVAREVLSDLEGRLHATRGRVEIGALPRLESDPLQMRQLLQNLIGNALKFHRPGVPPAVVLASQPPSNGCVEIEVRDNGIGFEEKYLDRIFTPFQRLHGRGQYEGTGMGLAICRKIVERHGGAITARSTPGQGSTFIVTLPLRQAKGGPRHA